MSVRRLAALATGCCLLAAACSVPRDDRASVIEAELLPEFSVPTNLCPRLPEGPTEMILVYAVRQGDEGGRVLHAIELEALSPVTPEGALRRLIECPPSSADQQRGITSVIPPVFVDSVVQVESGPTRQNWEIRLRSRGVQPTTMLDAFPAAQMLFTVTSGTLSDQVDGVRFMIDGELVLAETQGAAKTADEFKTRDDYQTLRPTTTTSTTTTTTTTTLPPEEGEEGEEGEGGEEDPNAERTTTLAPPP